MMILPASLGGGSLFFWHLNHHLLYETSDRESLSFFVNGLAVAVFMPAIIVVIA
jgi:hypothetical protein